MPARPPSANPYRNVRLWHQARAGLMLTLRCTECRRQVHYWAADLVQVLGDDHQAHVPPWPCRRCRSIETVDFRWWRPSAEELQAMTVRRPVKQVLRWLWANERA